MRAAIFVVSRGLASESTVGLGGPEGQEAEPCTNAEAMRLEIPPFMKRLYERGVKMAVDQELIAAHAEDRQARVTVRNMHTTKSSEYFVDHLVVEAGTLPNDGFFYELKEESANNGILDLDLLVKGLAQT